MYMKHDKPNDMIVIMRQFDISDHTLIKSYDSLTLIAKVDYQPLNAQRSEEVEIELPGVY